MDDQGARQNDEGEGRREDDEEERRRMEERLDEERVEDSMADSTEVRIGRKLREIGDQFHQEHVQLVRVKDELTVVCVALSVGHPLLDFCVFVALHCEKKKTQHFASWGWPQICLLKIELCH